MRWISSVHSGIKYIFAGWMSECTLSVSFPPMKRTSPTEHALFAYVFAVSKSIAM